MILNDENISSAVVAFIAPFLPYLVSAGKTAGKKLIETIAEKGGEVAWSKAQALWNKIKTHFTDTPALQGATLLVADVPDDETYRQVLTKALITCIQRNPAVALELIELIGNEESIQKVLINEKSWGENIDQNLEGPGKQITNIDNGSIGINITQTKK